MNRVVTPRSASQLRTALATNSGPLSQADVLRDTVLEEELRECEEHIVAGHPSLYTDRQTLSGVLIDDRQQAQLAAVVGPLGNEVIGPDVVGMLGPQTDARAVGEPETPTFGLLGGNFESLGAPDALPRAWR